MTTEDRDELVRFLEVTGMNQATLARYLGIGPVEVNRWVAQRPTDARPVPQYAKVFMAAYLLLSTTAREKLAGQFGAVKKPGARRKEQTDA